MAIFFKVLHVSSKSRVRLGEIKTSHGIIKTPAFVPVGTKGSIKSLTPQLIKDIGVQVAFVNTYHLVTHPGVEVIEKAGGIHKFSRLNIPLMSDSGGFQVFSLAHDQRNNDSGRASLARMTKETQKQIGTLATQHKGEEIPAVVKISDDGVKFRSTFDGELIEFTPEKSMEYQRKIGADINMAFDECISYGSSYNYSKKATERTHRWLLRSIGQFQKSNIKYQKLFGIIQGGIFEDLRKKSAEFVASQNTDGVAIGGVSVGETKKEMRDQVMWVSDYLPKDRPVHLLGVGQIDDIIDLVKYGIDTFDCVEPTRKARMGAIFQNSIQEIDIFRGVYRNNLEPVDENCNCYVCQNFTKSYLHHLFKQKELLGYTLATYHNLWVMEKLFDKIREAIKNNLI